jgi:hypothetical protein
MSWAVRQAAADEPFTIDRLTAVHARLLAGTRMESHAGRVRTEQNWIGGSGYNPCGAAFVPPRHVLPVPRTGRLPFPRAWWSWNTQFTRISVRTVLAQAEALAALDPIARDVIVDDGMACDAVLASGLTITGDVTLGVTGVLPPFGWTSAETAVTISATRRITS